MINFTLGSCEQDEAAKKRAHWYFTAHCRGCCARAAARSHHFFDSRRAGGLTKGYRQLLEQFGLTHAEVRAAHEVDHETKAAASR